MGQGALHLVGPVAVIRLDHQLPQPVLLVLRGTEHHLDRTSFPSVRLQLPRFGTHCEVDAGVRCEIRVVLRVGLQTVCQFELYTRRLVYGSDDFEAVVDGRGQEVEIAFVHPFAAVLSQDFEETLRVSGLE